MSKTLFGKVLAAIFSVFVSNFPDFVKKLFKKIPEDLKTKLATIIQVVANLEIFLQSPGADLITDLIPGYVDDDFKEWLKTVLPPILEKMNTEYYILTEVDPDRKVALLHTVATLLIKELTGSSFGQAAITAEVAYQNFKKDGFLAAG